MVEMPAGKLSVRRLLDAAEHQDKITVITRFGQPVAVIVPVGWYEEHKQE